LNPQSVTSDMDAILCVSGKAAARAKPADGFPRRDSSYTAACAQRLPRRSAASTRSRGNIHREFPDLMPTALSDSLSGSLRRSARQQSVAANSKWPSL
jgi:hypothetical protein